MVFRKKSKNRDRFSLGQYLLLYLDEFSLLYDKIFLEKKPSTAVKLFLK